MILEYFNSDFANFVDEFNNFVVAITTRGAGDRIFRGEFPLKPAAVVAPVAKPIPAVAPVVDQPGVEIKSR